MTSLALDVRNILARNGKVCLAGNLSKLILGHSSAKLFCCRMNLHGQHGCLVMLCALLHALLMTSVSCVFLRPCWRAVCCKDHFSLFCVTPLWASHNTNNKKNRSCHTCTYTLVCLQALSAWCWLWSCRRPPGRFRTLFFPLLEACLRTVRLTSKQ